MRLPILKKMRAHCAPLGAIMLFGLTSACGYTSGGEGTGTLEVFVAIEYDANDDETDIEARVRRGSIDVVGATVVLKDDDTDIEYTLTEDQGNSPWAYSADKILGYHRRLSLEVRSGSDYLEAKLEGPGKHTIEKPVNAAPLTRSDIGSNLEVEWATEDGVRADEVQIKVGEFETTLREDDGSFDVPQTSLNSGQDELKVGRRNLVDLAGGVGSSNMYIAYEVKNDIIIQN